MHPRTRSVQRQRLFAVKFHNKCGALNFLMCGKCELNLVNSAVRVRRIFAKEFPHAFIKRFSKLTPAFSINLAQVSKLTQTEYMVTRIS